MIGIAPCRDHISKALRYGTRSQEISQFYLHTPRSSADGMNHTFLCSAVQTVARNHECERDENLLTYDIEEHDKQTWIQDLLIQDQDQDFDVQDQY